jgi:3' exoribonuclease, RNase T-like
MPSWIFIDTEFTNLAPEAELISFAAVADDGKEFYCEIAPTPGPTSEFVRRHVLPLLDGGAATCPRAGFGPRLAAWLAGFDDPVLLSDSDWDIYVVRQALSGEHNRRPGPLLVPGSNGPVAARMMVLRMLAADELTVFNAAVATHMARDPRPHHALVDARAIRDGMLAVHAARAGR